MPAKKTKTRAQALHILKLAKYSRSPYGRMKSRICGRIGGRRRIELYGLPGTVESRRKGGRITAEKGLGVHAPGYDRVKAGRIGGLKSGPIAASKPGYMAALGSTGGRIRFERHGSPATAEGCAKGGRTSVVTGQLQKARCVRWHGRRKGEPICSACQSRAQMTPERRAEDKRQRAREASRKYRASHPRRRGD